MKVNDPDLFGSKRRGHICRCTNCKKTSGSCKTMWIVSEAVTDKNIAAATNLIIENEKFVIEGEDKLKEFVDTKTLSGTPLSRYFCSVCGK